MNILDSAVKKYKKVSEKKFFYLIASMPWAIFVFCIAYTMLKHGYISYETNDDAFLNLIVSGTYGQRYATNIYNNVILGQILTIFYGVSKNHNWYTIFEYLIFFSGLLILGVCNICRNKILRGYVTNFIFAWATINSMICNMNYSKTGAFAMMVGIFMMGVGVDNDEYKKVKSRLLQICAVVYIFIGGLYRKDSIYAVIPFVGIFVIYLAIKYKKDVVGRIIPLAGVSALLLGAWIANTCIYNSDPDWKYYEEFNKARTAVLDYGVPDYNEYREEYEAIGLTQVDVLMLNSWYYADDSVFTIEKLNQIVEIREKNKTKLSLEEKIEELALAFWDLSNNYRIVYILLFMFLALCVCSDKSVFVYQLMTLLMGAGEVIGLIYIQRTPERSIYIAAMSAIILLMYFSDGTVQLFNRLIEIICLGLIGCYAYYANGYSKIEERYEHVVYDKTYSDSFFTYLDNHSDSFYVYSVQYDHYFLMYCYSPLEHPNEYMRTNSVMEGSWLMPSPILTDLIEPYGDKYNLFKIMAENENVYWIIDGALEGYSFIDYMELHYGVEPEIVDNIAGVYEVVSFSSNADE